ncbi:MAG: hypothetical protein ACRD2C_19935 [Acidimicrobiales bacterium]
MSVPDVDDRLPGSLERAANDVVAIPSARVREQIRQRTRVLQRRRRARVAAVGVGLLVVGLGGGLLLRDDGSNEVTTASPPQDDDPFPAFTVDGLQPARASEDGGPLDVPEGDATGETIGAPSYQVFRRPDDYAGPTVYVMSGVGIGIPEPGTPGVETVDVGGYEAGLSLYNPDVPALGWRLPDGRVVYIRSWALSTDELLGFAAGLQPREGGGFDTTVLPQQVVEDLVEPSVFDSYRNRELQLEGPGSVVEIFVELGGERAFEQYVDDRFDSADAVEQLVVFGRPAVLIHYRDSERWSLQWRHTTTARVEVVVEGGDRTTVDDVIAGLREIDESAWQDLLRRYRA